MNKIIIENDIDRKIQMLILEEMKLGFKKSEILRSFIKAQYELKDELIKMLEFYEERLYELCKETLITEDVYSRKILKDTIGAVFESDLNIKTCVKLIRSVFDNLLEEEDLYLYGD